MNALTRRAFGATAASAALAGAFARPARAAGKAITVWWNQGYYPQEDAAFRQVVSDWEKKTGNTVNLTLTNTSDIVTKIVAAITTGDVPDIAYADIADFAVTPQQAWKGKLVDVSDVVDPLKNAYSKTALKSVNLYNDVAKKRSFYAVPLKQQALHNFYWRPLIEKAGYQSKDIPNDWKGYWSFFEEAQKKLRAKGQRIYGLGFTISSKDSDNYYLFNQLLLAYGGMPVSEQGKLLIDTPEVKKAAIDTLGFIGKAYKAGYIPPSAVNWGDSDNNAAFYAKQIIMTPNASLSIPEGKREDKQVYEHEIVTNHMPLSPAGKTVTSLIAVKSAFIPQGAKNVDGAKDFLSFLSQPKRLDSYLVAAQGRWFPVMPEIIKNDPFWTNPKDPAISVASHQEFDGPTTPWPQEFNPAYAQVNAEQVWGKAVAGVVLSGHTPEQAYETAAKQIKQIFSHYQIPT